MHANGHRVTFDARRRPWRRIVFVLFGVCTVLLGVLFATSPGLDSDFGLAAGVVLIPLWSISVFGVLLACFGWFIQVRQGGAGPVAWMDAEGIHLKGDQTVSWPDVESVFTHRTATGELLLCVRPTGPEQFIRRAPSERQATMRSNLESHGAPLFINLSAFWQGTVDDLSAKIAAHTSGRLSLTTDG